AVRWGRSTILDQPAPSTCDLTMLDQLGGRQFRELVRIGSELKVLASATIYPLPGQPGDVVLMDYTFSAPPVPPLVATNTQPPALVSGALQVRVADAIQPLVLDFTPGPPEPPGGNPAG